MKKLSSSIVVALPLVLSGCLSGLDSAVFMPAAPAPRDQVVRIYQAQRPTCQYEELGLVTWRPVHGWQKLQKGIEEMRERAREMGGDAIINFSVGDRDNGVTTRTVADSTSVTVSSSIDRETRASGVVVRCR